MHGDEKAAGAVFAAVHVGGAQERAKLEAEAGLLDFTGTLNLSHQTAILISGEVVQCEDVVIGRVVNAGFPGVVAANESLPQCAVMHVERAHGGSERSNVEPFIDGEEERLIPVVRTL